MDCYKQELIGRLEGIQVRYQGYIDSNSIQLREWINHTVSQLKGDPRNVQEIVAERVKSVPIVSADNPFFADLMSYAKELAEHPNSSPLQLRIEQIERDIESRPKEEREAFHRIKSIWDSKKAEADKERAPLRENIEKLKAEIRSLETDIQSLDQSIEHNRALANQLEQSINHLRGKVERLEKESRRGGCTVQ